MTNIDNYNPLDKIKVTRGDVERWEEVVLNQLEEKQYITIQERLLAIQNQTLKYSSGDAERVFQKLTDVISDFLAYQEAVFNLMRQGEIMPVIPSRYSFSVNDFRIKFEETSGGGITSGERQLNIPIFVHNQFIRTPSLRSK